MEISGIKKALFCAFLLAAGIFPFSSEAAPDQPTAQIRVLAATISVAPNGGSTETIHAEIRANNAATAMRLGQTSIGYDSSLQDLKILEAHTLKANGEKIPVDISAIYDQAAAGAAQAPMFTDQRAKIIVFPQFAAGDTAVYTLRLTSRQPLIAGEYWYGDMFPRVAAFDNVQETIIAPRSLPLVVENHGVEFKKTARGENVIYSWHYSAPHPAEETVALVSPMDSEPRFFVSTFKNYAQLGSAYARLSDSKAAVTPKIKQLSDQIVKGSENRRVRAQRIYEWVTQHIRYVAVELGKGSLEPHAADVVLSNGYGDCKDHVVLLSALLKAQGIASYGVLINATNSYTLTNVPTFMQLDHIITWIPEFKTYADSSAVVAPFGVLPFQEYGKPVVYVDQVHAAQGRIPVLQPGVASVTTQTVSRLSKDGVLSGTTTTSTSGPYTTLLRSVGLAAQELGSNAAAEKLLASLGYAGATGTLDSGTPTDLQPNYTTTGTFSAPGWSDKLDGAANFYLPGGMRLMSVSGDGLMGPFNPGKLADTQPTQCYSGHAAETLSLQIPPSVRFSSVPHDVRVKTANITFTAHWSLNKNTLAVHREFASTVDQPLCTGALRKQTAAALKEISDSYDVELSLVPPPAKAGATTPSQNAKGGYKGLGIRPETLKNFNAASAAIQNSDFNNGIRLLTAVLADKSLAADQRYVAYTNRASAYYSSGRFQQAIDDISQAIKLRKGDARAYGIRASLFERTGNHTAALADYSVYARLAPNDRGARVESGNLNFQDANYVAAIKDFSAALAMNGNDPQTLTVRGMAYEKIGDYDRAAADFGQAAATGDIDQNGETRYCVALSRGHRPSLAIPQCEISLRADPYSGDSLEARGYAYFRLGKYKDALKDFTVANHVYPANAEYLYSRGAAKLRLGDKSGGNQDLQAARQISPGVDQKMAAQRLVP